MGSGEESGRAWRSGAGAVGVAAEMGLPVLRLGKDLAPLGKDSGPSSCGSFARDPETENQTQRATGGRRQPSLMRWRSVLAPQEEGGQALPVLGRVVLTEAQGLRVPCGAQGPGAPGVKLGASRRFRRGESLGHLQRQRGTRAPRRGQRLPERPDGQLALGSGWQVGAAG